MRGHCLILPSAEKFINDVWGRLSDSLKVTERTAGPEFKLESNCAALVDSVFRASQKKMRQDWTPRGHSSPPSHPPQSIQIKHWTPSVGSGIQETKSSSGQERVERSKSKILRHFSEQTQHDILFLHNCQKSHAYKQDTVKLLSEKWKFIELF